MLPLELLFETTFFIDYRGTVRRQQTRWYLKRYESWENYKSTTILKIFIYIENTVIDKRTRTIMVYYQCRMTISCNPMFIKINYKLSNYFSQWFKNYISIFWSANSISTRVISTLWSVTVDSIKEEGNIWNGQRYT